MDGYAVVPVDAAIALVTVIRVGWESASASVPSASQVNRYALILVEFVGMVLGVVSSSEWWFSAKAIWI